MHKINYIKIAIKDQNQPYITSTDPLDLKLRPMVAVSSCPTHRLSIFVDILLKNMAEKVPSYICDSMDFLKQQTQSLF